MGVHKPEFDAAGLGGRVVVFAGGDAAEREISLASGREVFDALQRMNIEASLVDTAEDFLPSLLQDKPAFAFIAVHGRGGEDGVLQGLLEILKIPHSGSDLHGSSLAMDKVLSKLVWHGCGVSTAEFTAFDGAGWVKGGESEKEFPALFAKLGSQIFVKPAKEGSSFGMSLASNEETLKSAIKRAVNFDESVLLERYISGPEYTVPILEGSILPSIRIETSRDFYDYQAKYEDDDTSFFLPSGLSTDDERAVQQLAREAFDALGCAGWGRVDVMRDQASGKFFVLEVNTVPGMTDHSLVPKSARSAGMSFDELVAAIINVAWIQHGEKQMEAQA